jgi:beta-N-acetylhexosaminidase
MKGLAEGGVIATGKHFPGRGDSTEDAHDTLPVLRVSRERLNKVDLYPYLELIPRGLPAIMTAHNAYPVLDDSGLPASLSKKIVTGLLRGELGFDGVVTTDAMGMKGMTAICETPEGCARAIAAGNDLVLVKDCTDVPFESFDYIKRWVKQGKISEARLNEAVRRILRMKLAYRIFADRYVTPEIADRAVREPVTRRLADESARRCITVLRDRQRLLPLSPRKKIMVLQPIFMLYQEKCNDIDYAPEQLYLEIQKHARDAVIVEFAVPETPKAIRYAVKRAADFDVVVAFTFTWRAPATSHKMIHALVKAGRKVVVVSNNIYDQQFLPEAKTLVVTHSAMPPSMKAAADVMFGKAKPQGVSPLVEK